MLFDGLCNLCSGAVQFIIKQDKHAIFKFASLQSKFGENALIQYGLVNKGVDSIVLIDNGKAYVKSTAALRIAKKLNALYPLLYAFIIVPPFIRDWVYDWIARNRFKWFGKKESCWLPTPELKAKFLDD